MNSARNKFIWPLVATALSLTLFAPVQAQFGSDSATVLPLVRAFDQPINADQYLIRPGEKLQVVFLNSKLPGLNLEVNFEGCVVDGNLGVISLAGKSLNQAREVLAEQLSRLYQADDMVISIGSIYSVAIQVVGRVNRPGTYTGFTSQHVSELIDSAGGLAPGGSLRNLTFHGGPEPIPADLVMAVQTGRPEFDPCLYAGSRLVVGEILSAPILVVGEVSRPGPVELLPGEGLERAVELAGGPTDEADLTSAYLVNDPNRNLSEAGNIQPGDRILVPSVNSNGGNGGVVVTGAARTTGRHLSLGADPTLTGLIQALGGLEDWANEMRITVFRKALDPTFEIETDLRYPLIVARSDDNSMLLQPGDSIHVPRLLGHVTITGAVARPGLYPYLSGAAVSDYVSTAGGYVDPSAEHSVEIFDRVSGFNRMGAERSIAYDGDRITIRSLGEKQ